MNKFALLRFKMHWPDLYAPTKSVVGYWMCPIDMPLRQMSKLCTDRTLVHMARIFLLFAQKLAKQTSIISDTQSYIAPDVLKHPKEFDYNKHGAVFRFLLISNN